MKHEFKLTMDELIEKAACWIALQEMPKGDYEMTSMHQIVITNGDAEVTKIVLRYKLKSNIEEEPKVPMRSVQQADQSA